jgi:hypothetical protein
MFNALIAMSRSFDQGCENTTHEGIRKCRESIKRGWITPRNSKAFDALSVDEMEIILDHLENHIAGPRSTAAVFSAFNEIISARSEIREREEA